MRTADGSRSSARRAMGTWGTVIQRPVGLCTCPRPAPPRRATPRRRVPKPAGRPAPRSASAATFPCMSHLSTTCSRTPVFKGEGFPTPTDERHCVNGISLKYAPANE